jgi:hypothetical protein
LSSARAPIERLIAELHVQIARGAHEIDWRELNSGVTSLREAFCDRAGKGVLESTPARWLVEFTADAILTGVSYTDRAILSRSELCNSVLEALPVPRSFWNSCTST